jgi:lysophospholipase L1-like esterase
VPAHPAARRARLAARLALAAASALGTLLCLELYLRRLPRPIQWVPTAVSLCRPLEDASGLRYELIPDQVATHELPPSRGTAGGTAGGTAAREVVYTINADGYRGELLPVEPAGELRVAMVGDSFVFGSLVDDDDTLPSQLEALLSERLGAGRVRVANLGVPGYQLGQLLALLEQRVARLEPDIVVLNLYVNDTIPAPETYAGGEHDPDAPPPTSAERWIQRLGLTSRAWAPTTPRERLQMGIRKRSALADALASALFARLESSDRRADHVHRWRAEGAGWQSLLEALERAVQLAERDGYELHVSMFPSLAWLQATPYPLADAHRRLAEACGRLEIPFHDLLPAFAGREPRSLWAHQLDQHPNPAGHRLAAECLAAELLEQRGE